MNYPFVVARYVNYGVTHGLRVTVSLYRKEVIVTLVVVAIRKHSQFHVADEGIHVIPLARIAMKGYCLCEGSVTCKGSHKVASSLLLPLLLTYQTDINRRIGSIRITSEKISVVIHSSLFCHTMTGIPDLQDAGGRFNNSMPRPRYARGTVVNNISKTIIAVSVVHKHSGIYRDRHEWPAISQHEHDKQEMTVHYQTGFMAGISGLSPGTARA